jgi:hypothetical protein
MRFLRSNTTISRSKACLERIYRISMSHLKSENLPNQAETSKVNVRVFLAAYMIVCFPAHVFETMGLLEQTLLQSARHLLDIFEQICLALHCDDGVPTTKLPRALAEEFPAALAAYLSRFSEWKEPDEAKLVGRIEMALLALVRAQRQLKATDALEAAELSAQIERLREKLLQLGGTAAVGRFEAAAVAAFPVSMPILTQ